MLITGASRGIGAATARLAAAAGYDLAINYRANLPEAERVLEQAQSYGARAVAIAGDVSSETDVLRMFERIDAEFGRCDVLINNAGVLEQQMRVESMTADRMHRIFATNVIGTMLCSREAISRMSTRRGAQGGCIVNVSSMAARLGSPNEYVDYAASKGAIDTFTIGLAKEVAGEGIRVNAVRPGLIDTDMHAAGGEPGRIDRLKNTLPMQRGGTAEEVARSILWLASDEASFITGALLDVSGGR